MKNKFLKSSLIYFIGNILLKGISFFTLPIFSRIMLPSDYGLFSLYTASLSLMVIFMGLQIEGTVNIIYNTKNNKEFDSYVANIILFPLVMMLVLIVIVLVYPDIKYILSVPTNIYSFIIVIQAFFGVITNIYLSELVIKKQPKAHLICSIVNTIINVILSISLVLSIKDNTYFARVMGGVISSGLVGIYILIIYIPRLRVDRLKNDWLEGLKLSLPLVIHSLSGQLLNVADRYMISKSMTELDVAMYGFSYNIGMIIQMLWQSINNAWVPWYFDNLKVKNNLKIRSYSKHYIIFFTIITSIFLLLSPELVILMGGTAYVSGNKIVPLIALSYFLVFLYSFYVNYEFYEQKTKIIPIATTTALVFNILLNSYFIPVYGIIGAAIATILSYLILLISHYCVCVYFMKHKDFPVYYLIVSICSTVVIIVLVYLFINNLFIRYSINIMIVVFYCIYIHRNFKGHK